MVAPVSTNYAYKSVLRRKQKNLFAILGIALGVALLAGVQIGIDSLTVGWQNSYVHTLGEREIAITGVKNPFFNESIAKNLQQSVIGGELEHVLGVTGRVSLYATVFWENEGTIETGINFMGIDLSEPDVFGNYKNKADSVIDLNNTSPNQVLVGRGLVELMKTKENELQKGDSIYISVSLGNIPLVDESLVIYDIYEDEGKGREENANGIVVPLNWIQSRLQPVFVEQPGLDSSHLINIIYCALDETIDTGEESNEVTRAIYSEMFENGVADAQQELNSMNVELYILDLIAEIMTMLGNFMWIFGSVIMFCGLLLITNIQMMSVEEREIQTGILRAIGTKKRQIILSFLTEAVFLGIIGAFFGLIGGVIYGWILVQMFGYFFGFSAADIPLIITPFSYVLSFVAGFIVAVITGVFPAVRASNVNIVQVIRGILPPSEETVGRKGLYLGILLTILGIILLALNPVNILEGPKAFERLNDAEAFYLPALLTLVGATLTASYFVISRKAALELMTGVLLFWPLFNIFIIFDWIKEGSGGVFYLLYIIFSMIVGTIALVGLNLNLLASSLEFIVGSIKGLSAVATVAFRQMASQKTRSTLTFAIFASVLTLNIFVATWTYSTRFGYDSQVDETSAGMDLIAIANQPINASLNYADIVENEYTDIKFAAGLTISESTMAFEEDPGTLGYIPFNDSDKYMEDTVLVSLDEMDLWAPEDLEEDWQFPFLLEPKKLGPFNITEDTIDDEELLLLEDEHTWRAVANNTHIDDNGFPVSSGGKPVIITSIYTFEGFTLSRYPIGDSLWFLDSTGGNVI
ncbi:MAG: ABC transporter permease, partial [Candidatus Hodarchaeota archaeon]